MTVEYDDNIGLGYIYGIKPETIEHNERLGEDIVYCSDFATGKNVSYQLGATEGKKKDTDVYAGNKRDDGKDDWSLMDFDLIQPLIAALKKGEVKYWFGSWKEGFGDNYSRRLCAARLRHERAYGGNPLSIDSDSGVECYHLACVAWNALVELYHARKKAGLL